MEKVHEMVCVLAKLSIFCIVGKIFLQVALKENLIENLFYKIYKIIKLYGMFNIKKIFLLKLSHSNFSNLVISFFSFHHIICIILIQ